jgi:uncharacterized membrane protein YphA (DoxX/SURF4 family)
MASREQSFHFPHFMESRGRLLLRVFAGLVFIFLGQVKFFDSIHLGTDAIVLPRGPEGFALYLSAIGVPFPLFNAYMVCLVEMICGALLMISPFLHQPYSTHLTRMTAFPLMVDMIVALSTVGVPNALGYPVRMFDIAVTAQPWRLPLEVLLLAITLYLLLKPLPRFRLSPRRALA